MATGPAARWMAAQLKGIARRQIKAMGVPKPPPRISEEEQIRRFQDGSELWRVEEGLVTQEDYDRYLAAMEAKLQGGVQYGS